MPNKILNRNAIVKLELEVVLTKEGEYYVAYCPALEISGYGKTLEKARKSFEIEMNIFLEETHQRGTLEKYLLKNGWSLQQVPEVKYQPPRHSMDKISSLVKRSKRIVNQEVTIPVC